MLGVLALEQALVCARWVLANEPRAVALLPVSRTEADVAAFWARVKPLRDRVLVHFDSWIESDSAAAIKIDSTGLHSSAGLTLGHRECLEWLRMLGQWASAVHALPRATSTNPPRRPTRVPIAREP
jgi:hypothetical protein